MNPMFSGHGLRTRRRSTIELDNDVPDVLQVSESVRATDPIGRSSASPLLSRQDALWRSSAPTAPGSRRWPGR